MRIVVAPEDPKYRAMSPTRARLRYVVTPRALVDAAATFPFFVELAIDKQLPNMTVLRVLRIFRILKKQRNIFKYFAMLTLTMHKLITRLEKRYLYWDAKGTLLQCSKKRLKSNQAFNRQKLRSGKHNLVESGPKTKL